MTTPDAGPTAAGQQLPIYASGRDYFCAVCHAQLPDGAHVSADYDVNGVLAGVRADTDPSDTASISCVHSCGSLAIPSETPTLLAPVMNPDG